MEEEQRLSSPGASSSTPDVPAGPGHGTGNGGNGVGRASNGAGGNGHGPGSRGNGAGGRGLSPRASTAARVGAAGALAVAVVVIALILLTGGTSYTLTADFQNASGLVTGDNVLIGPAAVGTVSSIGLTPNGQAVVRLSVHGVGTLHQGTVARIYEDSLSGIASKYVELEPGPAGAPPIPNGGRIGAEHTFSAVNLDELFNTFNAQTRSGLQNLIQGEAASLKGKGAAANRTLKYLSPGLQSTTRVTQELTRDEPAFDGLVVQGARAMQTLAAKSAQLTQLIANTSTATGAIARQSVALQDSLGLLPPTLRRSTTTFAGLNTTLNALDPVVVASKPASRQLPQFAAGLNTLSKASLPTISSLNRLISDPTGSGDLTQLALETPSLTRIAGATFPQLVKNFTESRPQIDYLRQYTPDVVAALTNLGQAGAYYDANGHYTRTQPALFPFKVDGSGQLVAQDPALRYQGLTRLTQRCPGSAAQAAPDGSAPVAVNGCSTSQVPPGP